MFLRRLVILGARIPSNSEWYVCIETISLQSIGRPRGMWQQGGRVLGQRYRERAFITAVKLAELIFQKSVIKNREIKAKGGVTRAGGRRVATETWRVTPRDDRSTTPCSSVSPEMCASVCTYHYDLRPCLQTMLV